MQSIIDFLNIHPIKFLICWFNQRHSFMSVRFDNGKMVKTRACCIVCGKFEDAHHDKV